MSYRPGVPTFQQSWSLTCEIVYYACAIVLRKLPTVIVLAIAGASVYVYTGCHHWDTLPASNIFDLSWYWLAGWLYYKYRNTRYALPLLAAALVAFLNDYSATPNYRLLMIMVAGFAVAGSARLPGRVSRLFNYLGDLSYPLYLTHSASFILLGKWFGDYLHDDTGVYLIGACLIAALFLHFVDLPCRRLAKMSHA